MDIEQVVKQLSQQLPVGKAYLKGSRLEPETADRYSDTDLVLVMEEDLPPQTEILEAIDQLGDVVGREVLGSQERLLIRLAILIGVDIHLLDLECLSADKWEIDSQQLRIPHQPLLASPPVLFSPRTAKRIRYSQDTDHIDRVWFLFFLCHKKFMREDYLIGMHLLMEIIRECLVLLMIERDMITGTNIHRFGRKEQLPEALDLRKLNYRNPEEVKHFLEQLGAWYDEQLLRLNSLQGGSDL